MSGRCTTLLQNDRSIKVSSRTAANGGSEGFAAEYLPAHVESIILAMWKDSRQAIQRHALKRIQRASEENIPNRPGLKSVL